MKNVTRIALALALVTGVSATALSVDNALARGWGSEQGQGQGWHGKRGFVDGQRGGRDGNQMLKQFDANNDRVLTRDELTKGLEKKITDNDKDGDGSVSLEEFKAEWARMTQDRMVRAFQRMDRDGSGKITSEELQGQAVTMFERMDRNNDGKLDNTDRPQRGFGKRGGRFMQQSGQQPAPRS